MFALTLAVSALIAGVSAAPTISTSCQNALAGLIANSDSASCLNAGGIVQLATATGLNNSIVTPANTWLTGMCAAAPCSDATLASIVSNVTSGCSAELTSGGITNIDPSTVVSTVQASYPTVREIACLKDTSSNTMCMTEELQALQSTVGTLSLGNIISSIFSFSQINLQPQDLCTQCAKEAFNLAKTGFPQVVTSADESALANVCGSNFTDGSAASNVQQTASDKVASKTKSAAVSHYAGPAAIGLVAAGSVFTLFA